ncbi:MAG: Gfo/Idh/MocA family oxidoreductase [Planctomycetales bacterium]|nr:Gfo/Idh/MocA family oxidoreductase [Planctomycetales bacterium]
MTNESAKPESNRRDFIKSASLATASASVLANMVVPKMVHAANDDSIRVGVIGTGGRGTDAVVNALTADTNTKLTAVADAFPDRAQGSLENLKNNESIADRVQVDPANVFAGFDAYKQVIDSGVDVVILTTPPHFRPAQLRYAIEAGKHCFVEKPIAVDAPGVRHVMETCALAKEKGLAVVSGLCWRYDLGVRETMQRIKDGAIGRIVAVQSEYNAGTLWHRGDDPNWSRMEYQIRNWLYYTWLSGDHICEQAVHSLDKTAWLMDDASPVVAYGMGGRQQRTDPKWGHIYDHHTVVYEYANGVRVFFTCRQMDNCSNHVDEHVMGTEGTAEVLAHRIEAAEKWRYRGPKPSMYVVEHQELFKSIREGNPINNGHYMCNSTMIAIMGRMCTYSGKKLTWDECYNSQQKLGPETYEWTDVPEPSVAIPGHYEIL